MPGASVLSPWLLFPVRVSVSPFSSAGNVAQGGETVYCVGAIAARPLVSIVGPGRSEATRLTLPGLLGENRFPETLLVERELPFKFLLLLGSIPVLLVVRLLRTYWLFVPKLRLISISWPGKSFDLVAPVAPGLVKSTRPLHSFRVMNPEPRRCNIRTYSFVLATVDETAPLPPTWL